MEIELKRKKIKLVLSLALIFAFGLVAMGIAAAEDWCPSKYGKDDELGAINEITAKKTQNAFKLVKKGKLYDLGQVYEDGIPAFPPRYWKSWLLFHGEQRTLGTNKVTYLEEVINASLGVGTQIDGLAHVGIDSVYYNCNHQKDFATAVGVKKFGMEKVPPVVTRGILIDMAAYRGVAMMEAGDAIMPKGHQGSP
jgi:hypothetical protein